MPATDRPPTPLSSRHPFGAFLLLSSVCLAIGAAKWPALASYVWQRHHVYLAVPEGMPDLGLPGEFASRAGEADAQLVELGNRILFGHPPVAMRLLTTQVTSLPPPTTVASILPSPAASVPAAAVPAPPASAVAAAALPPAADSQAAVQPTAGEAIAPAPPASVGAPVAPLPAHPPALASQPAAASSVAPPPPHATVPAATAATTTAAAAPVATTPPVTAAAAPATPDTMTAATAATPTGAALIDGNRIGLRADDKVLFCGDSLMQGLAPMMAPRLKRYKIAFKDLSKQSTGLAYPHYFDWPKTIRDEIAAKEVTVLVVMLGANDAWDIINQGKAVPFNSPGWHDLYRQRVESIAQMADEAHLRVIWVGLPPMDAKRLTTGAPVLNQVFREVTSRHPNTLYIPAADVLTDDGVTFTRYKTNNAGLVQLLRANDGIHLAPAGNRLLSELIWSHVEFL